MDAQLWPAPDEVTVDCITAAERAFTIIIRVSRQAAHCPTCGRSSARIHSRYQRRLADVPYHGVAVSLQLHTRRFFCTNTACSQRIFTERFAALAKPSARRTLLLHEVLHQIGLAPRRPVAPAEAAAHHRRRDTARTGRR